MATLPQSNLDSGTQCLRSLSENLPSEFCNVSRALGMEKIKDLDNSISAQVTMRQSDSSIERGQS